MLGYQDLIDRGYVPGTAYMKLVQMGEPKTARVMERMIPEEAVPSVKSGFHLGRPILTHSPDGQYLYAAGIIEKYSVSKQVADAFIRKHGVKIGNRRAVGVGDVNEEVLRIFQEELPKPRRKSTQYDWGNRTGRCSMGLTKDLYHALKLQAEKRNLTVVGYVEYLLLSDAPELKDSLTKVERGEE